MKCKARRPEPNIIISNSGEIWYLTFEKINDYGSGLATYIRNVAAAVRQEMRPIRIFQVARGAHTVTRAVEAGVNIVNVPDAMSPEMASLGYWMNLSWRFAETVCSEIAQRGRTARHRSPRRFRARIFSISAQTGRRSSPTMRAADTRCAYADWRQR